MQTLQGLNLSLTNLIGGIALGATVTASSGCFEDPGFTTKDSTTTDATSSGSTDGTGGVETTDDSTGESTGGEDPGVVPGSQYIPKPIRPSQSAVLPATWAYALWLPGTVPGGKNLDAYEVCVTDGDISQIDDANECPGAFLADKNHAVFTPLQEGVVNFWKLRALYSDGWTSEFTAPQSFSTDSSNIARWRFEGNFLDEGQDGYDGTLQNEADYAQGVAGQGLSLDGVDDHATVPHADDLDFGAGDFAIGAWIHPQRDGVPESILAKRTVDNGYELYRTAAGQLAFFSASCGNAAMGGTLPTDTWRHVMAVRSDTSVHLYIGGVMVGSGTCSENFANGADLTFGCNGPNAECMEPLQGVLDEMSLYRSALLDASIINDFCSPLALNEDALPSACQ